jgi:hypothetical protein
MPIAVEAKQTHADDKAVAGTNLISRAAESLVYRLTLSTATMHS